MSGSDLCTGTLELLILRSLSGDPLHGYGVGRHLRATSSGGLDVEEGALYPALHRLERKGLLGSTWGKTDTGRRAKFYALTAEGRSHLDVETARWNAYANAVGQVLTEPAEG